MFKTLRGLLGGLTAAILLLGATGAWAAETPIAFSIPREPLKRALVDFAIQARLSISTGALAACRPTTPSLKGRFTPREGLARLLAGSGCGFRFIDAQSVEIIPLPRPMPEPPVRPAPPPPPPTVQDVAPIVVVATRAPTPIDQLAYSVSAVTRAELLGQGATDAGGLALLTPAMTVTNLGQGRDKILLRGLSDGPLTGRTQSMVGVYLDDMRITSSAPDPDLRLTDIAQVEVLRGPQGALYGSGSLGGVVHLITVAPDPTSLSGWVSGSAGATRGGDPSSTLEGMINLPLFNGRAALRLVAWREVEGGYIDDAGLGLKNVNRSVRQGRRASLSVDLSPDWSVTFSRVDQAINADDTQYALAGLPPYVRSNALREPHDSDFSATSLSVRGDLGWSRLRWSTSLVQHALTSRYDATSAPPLPMPAGLSAFDDDNSIRSLISEASLTSPADAKITWLGGIYLSHTRQIVDLSLTGAASSVVGFTEHRLDRLDEAALFGEIVLPLTSRLDVTVGGRLFSSRTRVDSQIAAPLLATASAFSGRVNQSGFAPKLVLSYRVGDHGLIYLQAAEGYRAGGLNTTGAPGQLFSAPGGPEPYRAYQGDELLSLELGGNVSLLDGRLRLRAAVFEAWWTNIQSDQLLASGLPFTANIGDGRNVGLEAEAAWRSGPLTLRGDLLVNSPELDHANPAFPARADLALAGVPEFSGGVSAGYGWEVGASGRIEVTGRYAWVGRSTLTFDAVTAPSMGGYSAARLAIALTEPRWMLGLAVDNPTSERGDTFAYGNPFTLRTARQLTPQRPATVSVTLKVSY